MKTLFVTALLFMVSSVQCDTIGNDKLIKLIPLDTAIIEAAKKVYDDSHKYLSYHPTYLMNITGEETYKIDVAVISLADITRVLTNRSYEVYGYFEQNGIIIIVFGNQIDKLFKKTEEFIDYINLKENPALFDGTIILPPLDIYIWRFSYNNEGLFFKEVTNSSLFERK